MKIQSKNIEIVMTPDEARILIAVMDSGGSSDPYGEAMQRLDIDIDSVVNVSSKFIDGLKRTVGWMEE